ncbi:hypothetical protein GCM10009840_31910 [Pseudolysinimonas kribbensis]|uniref:Uncharacterized protein n=1 Tax=Pseudolysinimonas kribbensis TaxID=433641 RepID=A0ABQ6KBF9_9MICO|nr:hypothetical protein [Pseudolysinimonas kribbensis]GMA95931.1 hypothetical protein GCM10025881_27550 [Pseudolysinimonas kribbensis]
MAEDRAAEPDPPHSARLPRRRSRRATTPPPPGSDPAPAREPERHDEGENDERMRQDKPPHY